MVVSSRRVGVDGFDLEGELYVKSRFRDGVEGAGDPSREHWMNLLLEQGSRGGHQVG